MSITREKKQEVIGEYRQSESDTGSSEVQVAVLSHRIKALTEHLRTHQKDHSSRRGLLQLVSRRRRLLNYLHRTAPETYRSLIDSLSLRR
ncbi:30S ribosomal protein S15 [Stratiformator vulcanicus]|uniref:Small ribosomal subunit protein uS15 n=1 Tax=Stratiformator vulcanicus TaxID=2527980 RepID=A0A517QWB2_9PLAN|nr:30S ribosomal protein S15 [Stratiformator vulcanicus]QDT35863.1 30S ribosomal protein S15 [Stratiformator vulcanicus]